MRSLFLSTVLVFSSLFSFGQDVVENVRLAFNAGSAKELVRYFSKSTEIKVNNESQSYSLTQAESLLRDFFQINPPVSFSYIHKGESSQGLKYNIGQFESNENTFRVVVIMKLIDSKYLIDTLNITQE